ncbi:MULTISPECIES: hypothetical protein [unclassified Microbacterium]|uniref:hypothetical protein n=1 Tax=unclassified Microbacterium TaxID=2609290 RepID=UPI00300FDCE0
MQGDATDPENGAGIPDPEPGSAADAGAVPPPAAGGDDLPEAGSPDAPAAPAVPGPENAQAEQALAEASDAVAEAGALAASPAAEELNPEELLSSGDAIDIPPAPEIPEPDAAILDLIESPPDPPVDEALLASVADDRPSGPATDAGTHLIPASSASSGRAPGGTAPVDSGPTGAGVPSPSSAPTAPPTTDAAATPPGAPAGPSSPSVTASGALASSDVSGAPGVSPFGGLPAAPPATDLRRDDAAMEDRSYRGWTVAILGFLGLLLVGAIVLIVFLLGQSSRSAAPAPAPTASSSASSSAAPSVAPSRSPSTTRSPAASASPRPTETDTAVTPRPAARCDEVCTALADEAGTRIVSADGAVTWRLAEGWETADTNSANAAEVAHAVYTSSVGEVEMTVWSFTGGSAASDRAFERFAQERGTPTSQDTVYDDGRGMRYDYDSATTSAVLWTVGDDPSRSWVMLVEGPAGDEVFQFYLALPL